MRRQTLGPPQLPGAPSRSVHAAKSAGGPVQRQSSTAPTGWSVRSVASTLKSSASARPACSAVASFTAPAHVDRPVLGQLRDRLEVLVVRRARWRSTSRPSRGARGTRRRCRRRARGSRGSTRGRRRTSPRTPSASRISPFRRSSCTTVPPTHWPRSLSGVQMSTCSTRGSSAADVARRRPGRRRPPAPPSPTRYTEGAQRVLERGELREQDRVHPLARSCSRRRGRCGTTRRCGRWPPPTCVAPSSSIMSTEPRTPRVAATSMPDGSRCSGTAKW